MEVLVKATMQEIKASFMDVEQIDQNINLRVATNTAEWTEEISG